MTPLPEGEEEKRPVCLNCGKLMEPYIDPKTGKHDGYSWRCKCWKNKNLIVSIG